MYLKIQIKGYGRGEIMHFDILHTGNLSGSEGKVKEHECANEFSGHGDQMRSHILG